MTVRNITIGTTEGDQTEITSGLDAGDEVVMTGVDKLNEGSKVNVAAGGDGGGRGGSTGGGSAADTQRPARAAGKANREGTHQ